jgi:TolB-like protein/DNA-binding winged helix-turn-helix (wHTH) protein/Flp pilus assembly protein TadD
VNDAPPSHAPVRFGLFELDSENGELLKQGLKVRLQEQPFQVLRILLEHPGKVVTRDELRRRIWPADTFVDFDRGLYNAIKKLREALGDDAQKPVFIETFSKRGYRFIGPVQNGTNATTRQEAIAATTLTETGDQEAHRKGFTWVLALGAAAVVALILVLGLNTGGMRDRLLGRSASPRIQSLAVLPLLNLSGDPAQEYFSDGMSDALITDLSQIGSFKVISRTSSMRYKKTDKSLPEIARELGADGIVEGTVQRSGDRVRITAQLIHGHSDKHLWANSYERDIHDVFALERDLTQEIAGEIRAQVKTPNARLSAVRPVNPKALEAYLQGSYYLNRFTEEETRKAQEYFQQAIDADPTFAAAYAGMAGAHYGLFQGSAEDAAIAKRAAERALELDPTLSDAWMTLGKIKLDSWDWSGMEQEYREAIEVNPNNASAHEGLGHFLDAMGRLDEGLKECQISQQLDPNQDHLSWALWNRREFDRSIEIELIMLRKDPDNVVLHHDLYLNYEAKGMYKDAIQHLGRTLTLVGFTEEAAHLHRAFAISGYRGAMREYAKDAEHLHATKRIFVPVNLAGVYTILGEKDRAFYWLEQAYKHSPGSGIPLWEMKLYPALDPLHSDPRFKDLLHRIGLPL